MSGMYAWHGTACEMGAPDTSAGAQLGQKIAMQNRAHLPLWISRAAVCHSQALERTLDCLPGGQGGFNVVRAFFEGGAGRLFLVLTDDRGGFQLWLTAAVRRLGGGEGIPLNLTPRSRNGGARSMNPPARRPFGDLSVAVDAAAKQDWAVICWSTHSHTWSTSMAS